MRHVPRNRDVRDAVLRRFRQTTPHGTVWQIACLCSWRSKAINWPIGKAYSRNIATLTERIVPIGTIAGITGEGRIVLPAACCWWRRANIRGWRSFCHYRSTWFTQCMSRIEAISTDESGGFWSIDTYIVRVGIIAVYGSLLLVIKGDRQV